MRDILELLLFVAACLVGTATICIGLGARQLTELAHLLSTLS